MSKINLRFHHYRAKNKETVNIHVSTYTPESGCLQVDIQYLWSGHIGGAKPSFNESSFDTTYTQGGTKEINLVVVSPTAIIDRNIDIVDVY